MAIDSSGTSRRRFFFGALFTAAIPSGGIGRAASLKRLGYKSPNEKLNVASIGAGGRPWQVLQEFEDENIVALADVDWARGAQGFTQWPKAPKYNDFRQMLDKSHRDIDAVLVGSPDHTHAACALACMQLGKHVYVEKPLTRASGEARLLARAAEKYQVATQMGNQGYSHDATRVACEIVWSGEIGEVEEVHAWRRPASWPQGMKKVAGPTPVPETLNWDGWLGGAAWREFTAGDADYRVFVEARDASQNSSSGRSSGLIGDWGVHILGLAKRALQLGPESLFGFYQPFNWRGFYDFGSGLIGDWGVHILGPANWALQLGPESLISVECVEKDSYPAFTFPDRLTLRYEFAARGVMPPVTVYWHNVDGDAYLPPGMTAEEARKIPGTGPQVGPPPGTRGPGGRSRGSQGSRPEQPARSGYNCVFVGSKGYLGTSGRGEGVGLLPGSRWAEYELPPAYLSRSPGATTGSNGAAHARDWVRACKGGATPCSNFSIAAPYTEWLVLGAAAVHYEGKLSWDNAKGEFSNNKDANKWVKPTYRKGWELKI